MSEDNQSLEEVLFELAVQKPNPAERAAFLDHVCRDNSALRAQVDALLEGHFGGAGFLPKPSRCEPLAATVRLIPDDEAPAQMLGRYKLLEKIGEGGFGEVWMAEQREPVKRRVALKIIKLGMDSRQIVARFEAERQALAMMDHANIAKIFDADVTDTGRPYFVMELVRGIRITEYCDQNQLPTQERLKLFILVCQAIQHAHQKGIIHRDIKPSNILVTLHDGAPVPKVIDFGIAKATQQELTDKTVFTQFQQFIGTPAYISPEQAEMSGLDIDTRADIYSLGVLLYELLVGHTPFDAKEMMQGGLDALRQIIREREPLLPSTKLNTLPGEARTTAGKRRQTEVGKLVHQLEGDLDWIVMKCLEKDRTRRYDTANGLASDIRRHLANEPVVARPPSAAYRFHKAWQRNKLAFTAGTAVAVALLVGSGVSTWQAFVARQQRRAADLEHERADAQRNVAEAQRNAAVEQRKLADMQLALQAWEEGDLQRANDLIEASRPGPGESPAFEWRYLRKLCGDQSLQTFGGSNVQYRSAQFIDLDLLLLNDGRALTFYDLSGRKNQTLLDDADGIWSPAFCSGNTNLLATFTDDGRIKVWDLTAKRVRVEYEGRPRSLTASGGEDDALTFSPDGGWLASVSSDKSVKLSNIGSGNPQAVRIVHRYASWACGGVFSPDGRHLFSGGSDNMVRTWEVTTGAEAGAPLVGHTSWIYALAIAPDGRRLAAGGADSTVIVWDVITRQPVTTMVGHTAFVNSLAFSPDGETLASAGGDQTIRLWGSRTGQQLSLLRGHGVRVDQLSFSPDGQRLVSRSPDGLVKVWPATTGQGGHVLLGGRSSLEVAWSPDGRRLAAVAAPDFGVNLWELSPRSITLLKGHSDAVMGVAFSPDGGTLATGSHDQTVKLWDVSAGKAVATLSNGFPVGALAFSPDGQTLIVGGSEHHFLVGGRGGLKFWDMRSHQATGTVPGDTSDVVALALSATGSLLATGHRDGAVRLWDVPSRQLRHQFASAFASAVLSLAFSPAEPLLVASDRGGHIVLYNSRTMEVTPPPMRAHTGRVTSLAFSPDGRTLASAGEGGGLKLWHVATRQVALTLKGHVGPVKGVDFSRDGAFLASCGLDGTVRLWPAATLEEAGAPTKTKRESR